MADGSEYPAEIQDDSGKVIWGGVIQYTDDSNQPGGLPLLVPPSGSTDIITVDQEGALLTYDADTNVLSVDAGTFDAPALGPTIPYVTVAAAAPTTYVTPIYVDTTAVTGASYAWDGSAYQEIANLIT